MMLTILEAMPDELLSCSARQIAAVLSGPTLIHLPGRREQPLFVSVLLHGNEDTGWLAVQRLLRCYHHRELPRALSLFIANVSAAQQGLRRLDEQPDYNRVWNDGDSAEHGLMRRVLDEMRQRQVFASVDIHNNTGLNPHYACTNRLEHRFLQFAALFSRTVVYFLRPEGVQSAAFARLCPAITVECGQPGQSHGVEHAQQFLEACLNMLDFPDHPVAHGDIDLFHTVATVKVPPEVDFGFAECEATIRFPTDLDRLNFSELPANTVIAQFNGQATPQLDVTDEQGEAVGSRYFHYENNEIRLARSVMPSMLTCDSRVIRQDCLCYLMERLTIGK